MVLDNSDRQAQKEKNAKVKREEVYRGKRIAVCKDSYQIDGEIKEWDIVLHPGAVVIIPVTKDKEILLVKQWRRAVGQITLEFPAGTLEKEEAPDMCAQRELREETGFRADLIALGGFFSAPGFTNEYLHLFLALSLHSAPLDCEEAIDLVKVSYDALQEMIETQQIQDAKTIAGFYRYVQWLRHQ